jgi:hypothetical protein
MCGHGDTNPLPANQGASTSVQTSNVPDRFIGILDANQITSPAAIHSFNTAYFGVINVNQLIGWKIQTPGLVNQSRHYVPIELR